MSGRFVLVASYPKSGNTWTRMVLDRLERGHEFALNNIDGNFYGILLRLIFDVIAPVNAADLLPDEFAVFLPRVYRQIAADLSDRVFLKVHDMARRNSRGEWMYPPDCVQSAIYIARHPFDVAVSSANHFGVSVERAISMMEDETLTRYARGRLPEGLPQWFGTWSGNVKSWLDDGPYQVVFARYEDLLDRPVPEFLKLARAAGFELDEKAMGAVVEELSFDRLQKYEKEVGFSERPKSSSQFFRAGRTRSWEGLLDESMRARIVAAHGATMRRLGYEEDGSISAIVR